MNFSHLSRKFGVIISSGIFLAVFFQNCAPPKTQNSNGSAEETIPVVISKVDISSLRKISLWDVQSGILLDVDPLTGDSRSFESFGEVAAGRHCLSKEDMNTLQSVLLESEVCEPVAEVAPSVVDQVCTQMYRYPYASLHLATREYRLGEQVNGCEKAIDLCGEKAGKLAAWSQAILATLETKICN